jgi:RNA polymerase sigma-70 factor (ECF subfamily)
VHPHDQESQLVDERELLRRARLLDESSLSAIFDAYYDLLFRYIYQHTGHAKAAEDLTSEVFRRFLEQLRAGRGPDRHLRAWLYRVAHNLVVDEARRSQHRNHLPLDDGLVSESQPGPDIGPEQQARAALNWLTDKQRAVIILKYLEGYEHDEIARILRLSVGAVKALQRRALGAMRRYLAREGIMMKEEL